MYTLDIRIDGLPPTINSNMYTHWAAKALQVKYWKKMVILHVGQQKPEKPLMKAKLTLTRVSTKEPDADGLVSSFKHIIDGLVASGVLVDDKMSNIGMPTYLHEKGKRRDGHIKIHVEEIT